MVERPLELLAPRAREALDASLVAELEACLAEHLRPCVWLDTVRVSTSRQKPGLLGRLFGAPPAEPVLGPLASKLGGRPYAEAGDVLEGHSYLGQLDLTAASKLVPGPALQGLLGLDVIWDAPEGRVVRARWYSEPSVERCVGVSVTQACRYEARIDFRAGFVAPPRELLETWFPALRDYDEDLVAAELADGQFDHRLFGPLSDVFSEYGPAGPGPFVQLLCLSGDQASHVWFGTNWLYLLVPEDDWTKGDLSRVESRVENY